MRLYFLLSGQFLKRYKGYVIFKWTGFTGEAASFKLINNFL